MDRKKNKKIIKIDPPNNFFLLLHGNGDAIRIGEEIQYKDVNERYSQELMNMVMQKYQAAEVGTFNPNLPLPM